MATPFSANSTCPVSRSSLGWRTPFAPPFGEGPLPQPLQRFPQGGVGWFWQTTSNVPQGGVRWFLEGRCDCKAAHFPWDRGKGDNRRLWRRADATTTTSFPHDGVWWFWQTTYNVPQGRFGWFWQTTANVPPWRGSGGLRTASAATTRSALPHYLSAPKGGGGGCILDPRPLSWRVFTAAVP